MRKVSLKQLNFSPSIFFFYFTSLSVSLLVWQKRKLMSHCYHGSLSSCVRAWKVVALPHFSYLLLQQLVPMRQVMWSRSGKCPTCADAILEFFICGLTPPPTHTSLVTGQNTRFVCEVSLSNLIIKGLRLFSGSQWDEGSEVLKSVSEFLFSDLLPIFSHRSVLCDDDPSWRHSDRHTKNHCAPHTGLSGVSILSWFVFCPSSLISVTTRQSADSSRTFMTVKTTDCQIILHCLVSSIRLLHLGPDNKKQTKYFLDSLAESAGGVRSLSSKRILSIMQPGPVYCRRWASAVGRIAIKRTTADHGPTWRP